MSCPPSHAPADLKGVVGGCSGEGVSIKGHCHLHSLKLVQLQAALTAPEREPFNLPSICRFVTILDESDDCSVICNLQEFNSWGLRGAVRALKGQLGL